MYRTCFGRCSDRGIGYSLGQMPYGFVQCRCRHAGPIELSFNAPTHSKQREQWVPSKGRANFVRRNNLGAFEEIRAWKVT
jgi:hypothetical protein